MPTNSLRSSAALQDPELPFCPFLPVPAPVPAPLHASKHRPDFLPWPSFPHQKAALPLSGFPHTVRRYISPFPLLRGVWLSSSPHVPWPWHVQSLLPVLRYRIFHSASGSSDAESPGVPDLPPALLQAMFYCAGFSWTGS